MQSNKLFMTMRLIVLLLFFILSSTSFADDEATDALTALLKNMHSLQADFVQTTRDYQGRTIQRSTGRMSLQRPNQFRWEVITPNKQLIITNGKRLWTYEPDLLQVTIRSFVKTAGEMPALLLSDGDLSLTKEFFIRANPSKSSEFFLTPKDKSSVISSLKMGFKDQEIHEMDLQDHLGHVTIIQFSHIKMNSTLPSSFFIFKPPAHVDIIDEVKH